ncbi:hypothetical protein O0I10_010011 [Lichtheimia ornata]|uniref:Uncharacterized protein n=1 Tax=Lichtheimia ornata TaxID=688661 RepID=A0AAD7UXL0_9FUNG|nr:uncharacterized protein O0I10_010011 [Lichtheimia ornata]KAJ8654315.1 hypothetical protein O0I10_010011 [Lichtheimia ornata]
MIHNSTPTTITTLNIIIMTKFISLFCIALMAVAVSSATQQTNGEPGTALKRSEDPDALALKRSEDPDALALKRSEEPHPLALKRSEEHVNVAGKRDSIKRDGIKNFIKRGRAYKRNGEKAHESGSQKDVTM